MLSLFICFFIVYGNVGYGNACFLTKENPQTMGLWWGTY